MVSSSPTSLPPPQITGSSEQYADDAVVSHQISKTIEAEGHEEDAGYQSDHQTTKSTSVTSNVRDYTFENGRRYHKFHEGTYQFPNDESEQEREGMKHAMLLKLCGGRLHFAPLQNPQVILDLRTGTGIWAIDMGEKYPSAEVLGVDLSPIQPLWVPPNVKFIVDDVEIPRLYPKNHFDLIHARHSAQSFSDFPKLLARTFDYVKPGGWTEFQEILYHAQCDDGSMDKCSAIVKWLALLKQALQNLGPDVDRPLKMSESLREAGFINVEEKSFKAPIGTWPKDKTLRLIGLYLRTVLIDGLQAISLGPLSRGLKWKREQIEILLVDVRKCLMDSSQHTYFTFHSFYGQKPSASSS